MISEGGNPNGFPTRDWLTRDGAYELAAAIKAYWAARGYVVTTMVEPVGQDQVAPHKRGSWRVLSDMVNGLPQRRLTA